MVVKFEVVNPKDLESKLGPGPFWVTGPASVFQRGWAERAAKAAQDRAPEWSGELKRSIKAVTEPGLFPHWSYIVATADYASAVEEGSRPHWPPVSEISDWAYAKGIDPFALAASIARDGTPAQPFMGPAAEEAKRIVPGLLSVFARGIESAAGRIR